MALAILELVGVERRGARVRVDCGTNRFRQLRIGRSVRRRGGIDWVDDVVRATPVAATGNDGELLGTAQEITIPIEGIDDAKVYVQLFSFKTPTGVSPAFSEVVTLALARGRPLGPPLDDYVPPLSLDASVTTMQTMEDFRPLRRVPCRTSGEAYARPTSLDELLASIVKVAAPLVTDLLKKGGSGGAGAAGAGTAGVDVAGLLGSLLKAILGGGAGALAQSTSLRGNLARPFIFGIDDALLASLAGPLLQQLPALLNAANQHRLQMKQMDNKLAAEALADVNRRLLLEELLQAQGAGAGTRSATPDLSTLISLLAQAQPASGEVATAPAAAPVAPAPAAPVSPVPAAGAKSLSVPSRGAVLEFDVGAGLPWGNGTRVHFARDRALTLRIRLTVGEPVPKAPLPRAILCLYFKEDADQKLLLQKEIRCTAVAANSSIEASLSAAEVARLPAGRALTVFAELRWPSARGRRTIKALGSLELVVANKYIIGDQGSAVSPEVELVDMQRFRSFWNKVWEAPTLAGDADKSLWELDVAAKYSVLLAPDHAANGLMETKLLQTAGDDSESLTRRTTGRMKAGIELALPELNKLLPLWDERPLDADQLEALQTLELARRNARETVASLRLKGRRDERGLVWVVPTFKLFAIGLRTPSQVADSGQIIATREEKVRFPLPVSVRLLGLKSVPAS